MHMRDELASGLDDQIGLCALARNKSPLFQMGDAIIMEAIN